MSETTRLVDGLCDAIREHYCPEVGYGIDQRKRARDALVAHIAAKNARIAKLDTEVSILLQRVSKLERELAEAKPVLKPLVAEPFDQ